MTRSGFVGRVSFWERRRRFIWKRRLFPDSVCFDYVRWFEERMRTAGRKVFGEDEMCKFGCTIGVYDYYYLN